MCGFQPDFVRHEEDLFAGFPKSPGNTRVQFRHPVLNTENEKDQIGLIDRKLDLLINRIVEEIVLLQPNPPGIDQIEGSPEIRDEVVGPVSCHPRRGIHDGKSHFRQGIHQRRPSDILTADNVNDG